MSVPLTLLGMRTREPSQGYDLERDDDAHAGRGKQLPLWPVSWTRGLLVALPLAFLGYGLAGWACGWALGVDSSVYRAGAVLLLHGHSSYDVSDLGYLHLSFTYPPAAALLFAPLAALPAQLAWAVMATASALALALAIRVAIATVPYWRFPAARSTLLLTAAMMCLVPVWRTIGLGQVNILLLAMVVVDVLAVTARGSRWGGLLVGVAAAVKLVPLIFVLHLLLTGKRAAAARALAVFAALQGPALVIVPRDSAYWTSYVFQTDRIGPAQQPYNQSLDGLMARVTGGAPWSADAAWAIGALLAVPAVMLVLRYHRRGQDLSALCVTACFGLLLAPVSWLPCWVWIVPVMVALSSWLQATWRGASQRRAITWQRWAGVAAVIGVIAVFASTYWVPISEQRHRTLGSFWFFVLSNSYVLATIAIAVVLGTAALRRRFRGNADARAKSVRPGLGAAAVVPGVDDRGFSVAGDAALQVEQGGGGHQVAELGVSVVS
jgi:alpha-1,2-mannosyltransferase